MVNSSYESRFGDLSIGRGVIDGNEFREWDFVPWCRPTLCSARPHCKHSQVGRCSVINTYLKGVSKTIIKRCQELRAGEDVYMRVGMHLMPLYGSLAKMKLVSTSVDDPVLQSPKGIPFIHPIFKEIRDTIKVIESCWISIGLGKAPEGYNPNFPSPGNYYDDMTGSAGREDNQNKKRPRIPITGGSVDPGLVSDFDAFNRGEGY